MPRKPRLTAASDNSQRRIWFTDYPSKRKAVRNLAKYHPRIKGVAHQEWETAQEFIEFRTVADAQDARKFLIDKGLLPDPNRKGYFRKDVIEVRHGDPNLLYTLLGKFELDGKSPIYITKSPVEPDVFYVSAKPVRLTSVARFNGNKRSKGRRGV